MCYQIILGLLVTVLSWSLLAAEEYVVKVKQRPTNAFSALQSTPTVQTRQLEERDAQNLRSQGFLVERNFKVHLVTPVTAASPPSPGGDDGMSMHWPGLEMHVPVTHTLPNSRGDEQTVCVVDTGIDKDHSIFNGAEIESYNAIDDSTLATDGQGHGTFVSSQILGRNHPSAPAPNARLIAVKALDDSGSGTLADVVRGIEYCSARSDVVNLSLGSAIDSEIMHQSIQSATAAGATVVAAAANSGSDEIGYPASYQEVIAVTSVDENLRPARFSARNAAVDITAPGVNVGGAIPGDLTTTMSGNSMAAAFVSGVVALQKSRQSRGVIGRDIGLPAEFQGSGLVDAYATARNVDE